MALDELHARRLATIMAMFEDALDRLGLLLEGVGQAGEARTDPTPAPGELAALRAGMVRIRQRLELAATRFEVRRTKPRWRQRLAAELSTLWVVLENAMPRRMKGYGREFDPKDRADWEALIRDLLQEIEGMRRMVSPTDGSF